MPSDENPAQLIADLNNADPAIRARACIAARDQQPVDSQVMNLLRSLTADTEQSVASAAAETLKAIAAASSKLQIPAAGTVLHTENGRNRILESDFPAVLVEAFKEGRAYSPLEVVNSEGEMLAMFYAPNVFRRIPPTAAEFISIYGRIITFWEPDYHDHLLTEDAPSQEEVDESMSDEEWDKWLIEFQSKRWESIEPYLSFPAIQDLYWPEWGMIVLCSGAYPLQGVDMWWPDTWVRELRLWETVEPIHDIYDKVVKFADPRVAASLVDMFTQTSGSADLPGFLEESEAGQDLFLRGVGLPRLLSLAKEHDQRGAIEALLRHVYEKPEVYLREADFQQLLEGLSLDDMPELRAFLLDWQHRLYPATGRPSPSL